jgi:uncharacterized RDD family membrane protein YckC
VDVSQQLRIDTPEQVALELPIAGIGSRFLAMVVDSLVQGGLYFIVAVMAYVGRGLLVFLPEGMFAFFPAILLIALFLVYWGYFAVFEVAWRGQTPGKRATNLRVIRDSGRPIDVSASLVRNLLRAIDALPMFYLIGIITMICNRQSKRLGDFAAGTVVVHDRAHQPLDTSWTTATANAVAVPGVSRLPESEIALVESFLHRRNELDWTARDRSAERIAARITARSGAVRASGQTTEEFLEAVARSARDGARYR